MPHKGSVPKRDVLPDPIHSSKLVIKLIDRIMLDGKRGTTQGVLYSAFNLVGQRGGCGALEVLEETINNIMPVSEVKARRVDGSNYQVSVGVRPGCRTILDLRWLASYVRPCGKKTVEDRLANEISDAANNIGDAIKKRKDTHKMVEANKIFIHYCW